MHSQRNLIFWVQNKKYIYFHILGIYPQKVSKWIKITPKKRAKYKNYATFCRHWEFSSYFPSLWYLLQYLLKNNLYFSLSSFKYTIDVSLSVEIRRKSLDIIFSRLYLYFSQALAFPLQTDFQFAKRAQRFMTGSRNFHALLL